jgi:hypothetical protein
MRISNADEAGDHFIEDCIIGSGIEKAIVESGTLGTGEKNCQDRTMSGATSAE